MSMICEDELPSELTDLQTPAFDLELLSPGIPPGYSTVPAWWAQREAEALPLLEEPVKTFFADAEKLQEICERRGRPYMWVESPPAFNRVGLAEARAFPLDLLAEFYPQSP